MPALAFVDLETTGATATRDRITEIGIVEVDEDGTVREWEQLLNPGVSISPFIVNLTGISNAMVGEAPEFGDVAAMVLEKLRGRLFIAHNARFDYGFLKNEFKRCGIDFRASVLCTVKLSRALYPEFKQHGLDRLIERHGLKANARHRALADAQLIHQFWQKIHVDRSKDEIAAALKSFNAHPSLPSHLDPAVIEDLPESPGIYLFYGEKTEAGDLLLYVGKAKNIRNRVLSHFSADHRSAREMTLAQQVRRIDWQETQGEIGALLREAKLVKALQPSHNRQLRRNEEYCTWQLIQTEDGWLQPRLTSIDNLDFSPEEPCYGLFKTSREATQVLRRLVEAHHLCESRSSLVPASEGKPCFGHQLRRCKGACVGKECAAQHNLRLMSAMLGLKLHPWPFTSPAILREGEEIHLIDRWRYIGSASNTADFSALLDDPPPAFDPDIYKILSKQIRQLRAIH